MNLTLIIGGLLAALFVYMACVITYMNAKITEQRECKHKWEIYRKCNACGLSQRGRE